MVQNFIIMTNWLKKCDGHYRHAPSLLYVEIAAKITSTCFCIKLLWSRPVFKNRAGLIIFFTRFYTNSSVGHS